MQLITLHKIMIVASLVMSLLFAAWALHEATTRPGATAHFAVAALGLGAAAGLGAYLRYFIGKTRRAGK